MGETTARIIDVETVLLPIDKLKKHPQNRPLGINREKIDQLKASISQYGYYGNQPLVVRSMGDNYQIVKGEHRFIAAQELGFVKLPCSIQEMTDEEALIQLIVGNIQTENKPLEIGLNALCATYSYSQSGLSVTAYGLKVGLNKDTILNYFHAAEVYRFCLKSRTGSTLLEDISKLVEIYRCQPNSEFELPKELNWLWLHNYVLEHDLSKNDTIAVCRAIRSIDDSIKITELYELLNIGTAKVKAVEHALDANNKPLHEILGLIEKIQEFHMQLPKQCDLWFFNQKEDKIYSEQVNLQQMFLDSLKIQDKLTETKINMVSRQINAHQKMHTKEQAEVDAEYFRDARHHEEIETRQRLEREQRELLLKNWLACMSIKEIAKELGIDINTANQELEIAKFMCDKTTANYEDDNWSPQLYTIWNFGKATNEVKHFGNIPPEIIDNLMYYYTQPFDVVFDPFGGGGSTIDKCIERKRRYYVSDLNPTDARGDIRQHDISTGLPVDLPSPDLIFLDPPYWKQANDKYSDDETDLANMPLDRFYNALDSLFGASKTALKDGGYIALIIGPTQKDGIIYDHAFEIAKLLEKHFTFVNRIIVPYTTQQVQGYDVASAREGKYILKLHRDLLVYMKGRNKDGD